MVKRIQSIAVGVAIVLGVGSAAAQSGTGRVITLPRVEIVGRVQKPIAAVEIARVQPKILLTEIPQPFLGRIERAVAHDPY